MKEIWKDVVGFEDYYQVSNLGQLRTISRESISLRKSRWSLPEGTTRIMKGTNNGRGYLYVTLGVRGHRYRKYIHRLIAEAFLSDYSADLEVNHKNGVKSDNSVANLEMVTRQENENHKTCVLNRKRRGVSRCQTTGSWIAAICYQQKNIHIGVFPKKEDAYQAFYNKFLELRGVAPWA